MKNPSKKLDPFKQNKSPKNKLIIGLSIVGVVAVVVIAASTLGDPPLFKGLLSPTISTVDTSKVVTTESVIDTKLVDTAVTETKVTDAVLTDTKIEEILKEELVDEKLVDERTLTDTKVEETLVKEEPIDEKLVLDERSYLEPVEKSEEAEEEEADTLEFVLVGASAMIPPQISFAYVNRLDANHPNIYGNNGYVDSDENQVVLIFRLSNTGTMPAYLKKVGTWHTFTEDWGNSLESRCYQDLGYCNYLSSYGARLVRLTYDSNGGYTGMLHIAYDAPVLNGLFEESNLTSSVNPGALEIAGGSDAYFAIVKDTTEYSDMIHNWAVYTRMHANSVLDFLDLKIVDGNGDEIPGFTIASDSFTPPVMIYTD